MVCSWPLLSVTELRISWLLSVSKGKMNLSRKTPPQNRDLRRQKIWNRSALSAYRYSGGRMATVVGPNYSQAIECNSLPLSAPIWQDVLAQAVTGELLAAMNYTSLAQICDDPEEVADAMEHAAGERGHASRFAAEGRKIGVDVTNNVDARHWKRLREAFMHCIAERDFIG